MVLFKTHDTCMAQFKTHDTYMVQLKTHDTCMAQFKTHDTSMLLLKSHDTSMVLFKTHDSSMVLFKTHDTSVVLSKTHDNLFSTGGNHPDYHSKADNSFSRKRISPRPPDTPQNTIHQQPPGHKIAGYGRNTPRGRRRPEPEKPAPSCAVRKTLVQPIKPKCLDIIFFVHIKRSCS